MSSADLGNRLSTGVGWVPADQALTAFGQIADPNPWGPLGDLRLVPDRDTEVYVDLWQEASPLHFFVCDATHLDGTPWDCCPRTMLKTALADLERDAGLRLIAAFEQEFQLVGASHATAFSLEAQRLVEPFGPLVVEALRQAGNEPDTFLPEYGRGQFELPLRPSEGLQAADGAISAREIVREVARRLNYRASFAPMVDPEGPGNGVHVHLSFQDSDGRPAAYDPERPGGLSKVAGQFVSGLLHHLPAITAMTAPSAVSYLRLRPHRWSAGFVCAAVQNREAAIRIAPVVAFGESQDGNAFNFEFRPADAAACPHLALAVIVRAGLDGIRRDLPQPHLIERDPADLSDEERRRLGVRPLPGSLEEALTELERDEVVRSWFSEDLWNGYLSVKRTELTMLRGLDPLQRCREYVHVY